MAKENKDETLEEILLDDEKEVKKSEKKKKGCLARIMIVLIILLVAFLGFIFIQQYLLDLEAQAIVSAARTATAEVSLKKEIESESISVENTEEALVETASPSPTSTEDPAYKRTATISVQLTDVAAFQLTATVEP